MKLKIVLLLMLLAGAFTAAAGGATGTKADVRKTIESSLLVTGTIDIDTDGTVADHRLDQPDKLPGVVRDLVAKAAKGMRFEPVLVDGKPAKARANMGMRVVARRLEDGNYQLRIASASFGDVGSDDGERVVAKEKLRPPVFPEEAYTRNISGTVYLVLKINRQGKVEDLAVEQINLAVLGNERQMEQARKLLAKTSLGTARSWTFRVPTRGEMADDPFWSLRVPIEFKLLDQKQVAYGQWKAYIPGPYSRPSWIAPEEASQNPDAMIAGSLYQAGKGPKLLTPVNAG